MSFTNQIETNKIAIEFLRLKKLVDKNPDNIKAVRKYKKFQNYCANKLAHLVNVRVSRYRKFSNYSDLRQDGFEALLLAFETYKPKKGDFTWWATKYISTRISRAANAHSTIRFPLKKAKEMQPYKTNTLPVLVDRNKNPCQHVEATQKYNVIMDAINELPETQRQVILMHHEFDGGKNCSISKISNCLKISRNTCQQLLEEAEGSLKDKLTPFYNEV